MCGNSEYAQSLFLGKHAIERAISCYVVVESNTLCPCDARWCLLVVCLVKRTRKDIYFYFVRDDDFSCHISVIKMLKARGLAELWPSAIILFVRGFHFEQRISLRRDCLWFNLVLPYS